MLAETMTSVIPTARIAVDGGLAGEIGQVPSAKEGAVGQQRENHPDADKGKHHRIHTEIKMSHYKKNFIFVRVVV